MATKKNTRIFMDPVHGTIALEEYLVKIIDTPEFQRLRKIKQTGGVCYVFPGATHTRFEHSLGVCHIAGHLIKELQERCPKYHEITSAEEICIKIAALCHDIGHGPFSHFFDIAIKENNSSNQPMKDHEYRSGEIIGKVISRLSKNTIESDPLYIANENIALIKAMIVFSNEYKGYKNICEEQKKELGRGANASADGPAEPAMNDQKKKQLKEKKEKKWKEISSGQPTTKSYLFEIVANGFTGIDVDKMDYFARDSRSVGLPNSFDWRRYIQTASIRTIIENDGTEFNHICSRDKEVTSLYELFHTRYILHRTVYQHKTVVNVQHMIKEALIAANQAIKFNGKCLLECYDDPEAFIQLTDSIEDIIIREAKSIEQQHKKESDSGEEPEGLLKAKKLFENITERKLPKYLGESKDSKEEVESYETKIIDKFLGPKILKFIITRKATFDYGKKGANPMKSQYFYDKEDSDASKPFHKNEDEVSVLLLPKHYTETKLFWYFDVTQKGAPKEKLDDLKALFKKDSESSS